MKTIVKTNEIITQKQLENGIWQFILDHSRPFQEDLIVVKFTTTDKNDLFRRIYARATGLYKIKDEDKLEIELQKRINKYYALKIFKDNCDKKEYNFQQLKKTNPIKYRVVLYLRKFINKLIK